MKKMSDGFQRFTIVVKLYRIVNEHCLHFSNDGWIEINVRIRNLEMLMLEEFGIYSSKGYRHIPKGKKPGPRVWKEIKEIKRFIKERI